MLSRLICRKRIDDDSRCMKDAGRSSVEEDVVYVRLEAWSGVEWSGGVWCGIIQRREERSGLATLPLSAGTRRSGDGKWREMGKARPGPYKGALAHRAVQRLPVLMTRYQAQPLGARKQSWDRAGGKAGPGGVACPIDCLCQWHCTLPSSGHPPQIPLNVQYEDKQLCVESGPPCRSRPSSCCQFAVDAVMLAC